MKYRRLPIPNFYIPEKSVHKSFRSTQNEVGYHNFHFTNNTLLIMKNVLKSIIKNGKFDYGLVL